MGLYFLLPHFPLLVRAEVKFFLSLGPDHIFIFEGIFGLNFDFFYALILVLLFDRIVDEVGEFYGLLFFD